MNKKTRWFLWLISGLLLASLTSLAGCSGLGLLQREPLPTLFVIPTLPSTITPSATLYVSPTMLPTQTPTATVTQMPTTTPTPLIGPTSTPLGGVATSTRVAVAPSSLSIQYFTATPPTVSPGGTVTLAWASTGANQATVFRVNADGSFGQSWQAEPTGTLTVTASGTGDSEKFVLRIGDGVNIKEAEATITTSCSRTWFFTQSPPASCPAAAPVSTLAAEQDFENGWIYWVQTAGKVYVLYEDGKSPAWEVYADTWTSAEPEDDPSIVPPSGLLQPIRGIGKVWRTNTTVRSRLGWAISDEVGFTSTFQQESGTDPKNIFFSEPGKQLTRLEGGGSSWRFGEALP